MHDSSGHDTPVQLSASQISTNPPTWQVNHPLSSNATQYSSPYIITPNTGSFTNSNPSVTTSAYDNDGTCSAGHSANGSPSTSSVPLNITISPPAGHPNLGPGLNLTITLTYSLGDS